MKKIIAICALLTAATSVFCETTQKETADVYEVEEQKQEEKKLSKRKQREEERKRREAPVELASSSVFRYNGFETDVKQDNTVIFYYPATKEIGFTAESTGELVLSFGKVAQETIKVAFNEYKDKFEKKELSTKKNKTSRIFGNTKCRYLRHILQGHKSRTDSKARLRLREKIAVLHAHGRRIKNGGDLFGSR